MTTSFVLAVVAFTALATAGLREAVRDARRRTYLNRLGRDGHHRSDGNVRLLYFYDWKYDGE